MGFLTKNKKVGKKVVVEEPEPVEEVEEVQEGEAVWLLKEVPTQTTQMIYNNKTKKVYDLTLAVVELLNRTEE